MATQQSESTVRQAVRETYGKLAKKSSSGCGCDCGSESAAIGYSRSELEAVPEGADLGLGSGNPLTLADLQPGEAVLDLGSGAGIDCFIAAKQVGETGSVIGVDMTPEMVARARENAEIGGYRNVDFHLGEIERLAVPDASVDVIVSNCVINLSPDKPSVYREAFRVLRPGGRLAISDIVTTAELPEDARNDLALIAGCVSGAATADALERMLEQAGFRDIDIRAKDGSLIQVREWKAGDKIADHVVAASVQAVRPLD
ncbi:MAG: arsenite methyltransferase [Rhodospirillales bacterium]|nr:arsenite methyltransferase [Rhodospirillales bacterium]